MDGKKEKEGWIKDERRMEEEWKKENGRRMKEEWTNRWMKC